MPIRQALPHRTIFNLLGPLAHPAQVKRQIVGVFDKDYILKMAQALHILGSQEVMVVASRDGLDEISISDISYYAHLKDGNITQGEIDPPSLGFKKYDIEAIKGGDATTNAKITYNILSGEMEGAMRDIVLINSAYLLLIADRVRDVQEGLEVLQETIATKQAQIHLQNIINISHKL